jgi:hypothetical protein
MAAPGISTAVIPPQALAAVERLWGPVLIGVVLNGILYGALLIQVALWMMRFKNDTLAVKCLVWASVILDTFHLVLSVGLLYGPVIRHYGTVDFAFRATWYWDASCVVGALIALMVQAFFGYRVHRLVGNKLISAVIAIVAILEFVAGCGTAAISALAGDFRKFGAHTWVADVWLVLTAVTDVLIAGALVWHLQTHRTGFSRSEDLIQKITRMTIQTGALTGLMAIADLVALVASPHTNIHFAFNMPLSKLYTNSLLSTLNARGGGLQFGVSTTTGLSTFNGGRSPPYSQAQSNLNTHAMTDTLTVELPSQSIGKDYVRQSAQDHDYLKSDTNQVYVSVTKSQHVA